MFSNVITHSSLFICWWTSLWRRMEFVLLGRKLPVFVALGSCFFTKSPKWCWILESGSDELACRSCQQLHYYKRSSTTVATTERLASQNRSCCLHRCHDDSLWFHPQRWINYKYEQFRKYSRVDLGSIGLVLLNGECLNSDKDFYCRLIITAVQKCLISDDV